MKDFGRPQVGGSPSCIVLTDAARNYELKTVHYNQLPSFHGSASEDALTFIRDFYGIVQHFPLNDLTEDALRMRCFPYTLKDAAKIWFMSLTPGSLRTWPEVYNKFIGKFYSHAKTAELRRKIATFSQAEGEPFHEAWERFKMLLIQCPHHGYPLELQNQTFYDGLTQASQSMVDNAAGGAMGEKTAEETLTLKTSLLLFVAFAPSGEEGRRRRCCRWNGVDARKEELRRLVPLRPCGRGREGVKPLLLPQAAVHHRRTTLPCYAGAGVIVAVRLGECRRSPSRSATLHRPASTLAGVGGDLRDAATADLPLPFTEMRECRYPTPPPPSSHASSLPERTAVDEPSSACRKTEKTGRAGDLAVDVAVAVGERQPLGPSLLAAAMPETGKMPGSLHVSRTRRLSILVREEREDGGPASRPLVVAAFGDQLRRSYEGEDGS
nr:uncharacterized protein LOC109169442 [Ipomoea trifida]